MTELQADTERKLKALRGQYLRGQIHPDMYHKFLLLLANRSRAGGDLCGIRLCIAAIPFDYFSRVAPRQAEASADFADLLSEMSSEIFAIHGFVIRSFELRPTQPAARA